MATHIVASQENLPPGSRVLVEVEGRQIGVFNLHGRYHAVLNRCADQGGPVCTGGLFDNVQAEVMPDGRVREYLDDHRCIIACPWHGWEYDLRSGQCLWNSKYHLRTFPVYLDHEGRVVIEI